MSRRGADGYTFAHLIQTVIVVNVKSFGVVSLDTMFILAY